MASVEVSRSHRIDRFPFCRRDGVICLDSEWRVGYIADPPPDVQPPSLVLPSSPPAQHLVSCTGKVL